MHNNNSSVCFLVSICALFTTLQLWQPNEERKLVISFENENQNPQNSKKTELFPFLIILPVISFGTCIFSICIFIRALKMRCFIQGKIKYYNAMVKIGEDYRPFDEQMNLEL